jgi:hypothetical protein
VTNPPALVSPANDPLTLAINRSFAMPWEGRHLDFRVEAFILSSALLDGSTQTMQPGEDLIVGNRLRQILDKARKQSV